MAIVALPILIVTSYVLYQRCEFAFFPPVNFMREKPRGEVLMFVVVVLGEEKKLLVPPKSKTVDVEVKKTEPSPPSSSTGSST